MRDGGLVGPVVVSIGLHVLGFATAGALGGGASAAVPAPVPVEIFSVTTPPPAVPLPPRRREPTRPSRRVEPARPARVEPPSPIDSAVERPAVPASAPPPAASLPAALVASAARPVAAEGSLLSSPIAIPPRMLPATAPAPVPAAAPRHGPGVAMAMLPMPASPAHAAAGDEPLLPSGIIVPPWMIEGPAPRGASASGGLPHAVGVVPPGVDIARSGGPEALQPGPVGVPLLRSGIAVAPRMFDEPPHPSGAAGAHGRPERGPAPALPRDGGRPVGVPPPALAAARSGLLVASPVGTPAAGDAANMPARDAADAGNPLPPLPARSAASPAGPTAPSRTDASPVGRGAGEPAGAEAGGGLAGRLAASPTPSPTVATSRGMGAGDGGGQTAPAIAAIDPGGSGPFVRPRGGYQNTPRYPEAARRRGVEGTTLLRFEILATGRVGQVHVERSAGDRDLDHAAAETIRAWTFEPARRGGDPIPVWVTLPVRFELKMP